MGKNPQLTCPGLSDKEIEEKVTGIVKSEYS